MGGEEQLDQVEPSGMDGGGRATRLGCETRDSRRGVVRNGAVTFTNGLREKMKRTCCIVGAGRAVTRQLTDMRCRRGCRRGEQTTL